MAHNGNITNAAALQRKLQRRGSIFQSTSDTETIIHLIATSERGPLVERMIDALAQIEGAFSLVALSEKKLIGCRDPLGVRPLLLGELDGAPVLASETCAFDIIGAKLVREVLPGELVIVTEDGIESRKPFAPLPLALLHFRARLFRAAGFDRRRHQRLRGQEADRRGACARGAGAGRHRRAGARFRRAGRDRLRRGGGPALRFRHHPQPLCRPHLHRAGGRRPPHGRAAEAQRQQRRARGASASCSSTNSIVRGTTSTKIVRMVRDAGAVEVHMRIASPPTTDPCFYGVDTPEKSKLLASHMSVEEMRDFIGVDSLGFHLDRRALPRRRRERPQSGAAAILRRLLHRRLSDPPDRPGSEGRGPPVQAPRRDRLSRRE